MAQFFVMEDLRRRAFIYRLAAFLANIEIVAFVFRRSAFARTLAHAHDGFAKVLVHGVITSLPWNRRANARTH
jgi:hypothetical protein